MADLYVDSMPTLPRYGCEAPVCMRQRICVCLYVESVPV